MVVVRARRLRRTAALFAGVLVITLSGCNLNAGAKAEAEFADHLGADFGDHVLQITGHSTNDLPGRGTLGGEVELRPDTPDDVFARVLAAVEAFEPRARVTYRPIGVRANGLTVCFDDPQRDAVLALRARLAESGQSLQGQWVCSLDGQAGTPGYRGTLAAFVADTELVRPHLGDRLELRLVGRVNRPDGTVSGRWQEVPPALGPVAEALLDRHDVVALEVQAGGAERGPEGNETVGEILAGQDPAGKGPAGKGPAGKGATVQPAMLRAAVDPTTDLNLEKTQAALDEVAGEALAVTLYQAVIDEAQQKRYAALGPLADQLREQPGVRRVQARGHQVRVTVDDPAQLVAVHDTATAGVRLDDGLSPETTLVVVVPAPGGRNGDESEYTRHATAAGGHIDLFAALVSHPEVSRVRLIEESAAQDVVWLQLKVSSSLEETLPALRGLLPEGLRVSFFGPRRDHSATVRVRERLAAEDITGSDLDETARQRLAESWNASSP